MSDQHNIDKLLKESFNNFYPDAPDVWQAVQQGVQAAQSSAAASSGAGATGVVQGVSLTVKIIAGIAIAAASVTAYLVYNTQVNKDTVKVADAVVKEQQVESKAESVTENDQEIKEGIVAEVPKTNNEQQQIKTGSLHVQSTPQVEEADNTVTPSVSIPEKTVTTAELKDNEENSTPAVKEKVIAEEPKSITKTHTIDSSKNNVSTQATKGAKAKPYNPNAEDGEVYEKPTVPNAFTPNDDGSNDKFKIIIENETYYSLRIINEKGETVFESKNKEQLWDGKHYKTGQQCQAGNYIYVLNYQYKGSEKIHDASGLVKLIF